MSHTVFQMVQIMPVNTRLPNKTLSPAPQAVLPPLKHSVVKLRRESGSVAIKASALSISGSSAVVDGGGDSMASLERCLAASPASTSAVACGPVMKGKYGATGAVTLEKSKLNTEQKQSKANYEVSTGGGGGDIGKIINNGGGDGGDEDDDDDYFDDFDDGEDGEEGGLFRRRMFLEELFDRKFVDAVLNEWQKTMMDLPAGIRQAYEMGLVSSAQMVRFLAINARPTTARFVSRSLPEGISRAFVGRMIADPAFLNKFILEQAATIGCSVWWEVKNRKHRLKHEWDLALLNVLTVSACNALVVWSLAPCRSYANTSRFDLQNTLHKLPNNFFEKSYPLREFDMQKRIQSLIYKAAELCTVGLTAGAVQGTLSKFLANKKEGRLSVSIPSVGTNALGYGAFLGLYANLRYQMLFGIETSLINHFDVIGVALFFGSALRIMNVQLGERSRLAWLGVEVDPLMGSDDLLKASSRPDVADSTSSSNWFISKNAVVKGLGLLGIKQEDEKVVMANGVAEAPAAPKARRKRVVRKVTTRSA